MIRVPKDLHRAIPLVTGKVVSLAKDLEKELTNTLHKISNVTITMREVCRGKLHRRDTPCIQYINSTKSPTGRDSLVTREYAENYITTINVAPYEAFNGYSNVNKVTTVFRGSAGSHTVNITEDARYIIAVSGGTACVRDSTQKADFQHYAVPYYNVLQLQSGARVEFVCGNDGQLKDVGVGETPEDGGDSSVTVYDHNNNVVWSVTSSGATASTTIESITLYDGGNNVLSDSTLCSRNQYGRDNYPTRSSYMDNLSGYHQATVLQVKEWAV